MSPTVGQSRQSDILHRTLGDLVRLADVDRRPLQEVFERLTETSSQALGVSRVNLWLYDESRTRIVCADHYDARTGMHSSGAVLRSADFPSYFSALENMRTIAAIDAENDPRTAELRDTYLAQHGITTMLDAPIVISGAVTGVVCHEHVGPYREWSGTERMFAANVADLVALAIQTDRRIEAERERAELRDRLHVVQRLESLGLLAGTVAHDFKNILMVVKINAEMLGTQIADPTAVEHLEDIRTAATRAQEVCDVLLSYAGRRSIQSQNSDIAQLAAEMTRLIGRAAPSGVAVEYVPGEPAFAPCDVPQIRQVILNLLTNAVDAVRDKGGAVRVRTGNEMFDGVVREFDRDWRTGPGRVVFVEVADTGVGMDAATRDRMFDPCFTTKSGGTGLGLAATLGIVRSHHGAIEVSSEAGAGTTIRIKLPAAQS